MRLGALTSAQSSTRGFLVGVFLAILFCWGWRVVLPGAGAGGAYEWTVWIPLFVAFRIGYHAYDSPHLAPPVKADLRRVLKVGAWAVGIGLGYYVLVLARQWIDSTDLKTITAAGLVIVIALLGRIGRTLDRAVRRLDEISIAQNRQTDRIPL